MIINNKDIVQGLYRINTNIGNNTLVVIRSKITTPKRNIILLGKIYCQGFSLVSARKEKKYILFIVKKVQEPKLVGEKSYNFFQTLTKRPYCEYLTPEIISEIQHKFYVDPKEKYTFLGKILNLRK